MQLASLLGIPPESAISDLQLEAYVTNRVDTTPFGSLRVRADNEMAIGAGLVLPIQFSNFRVTYSQPLSSKIHSASLFI